MKYCVYCHTNKIDGKRYVGITSQKPEKRWGNGNNYTKSPYFNNAIKTYGWEEFKHDILFTGLSKEEAQEKERYLISKWNLNNRAFGYNIQKGGEGADAISDETRVKMSKSKKGKKLSDITKQRMSLGRTGSKHFASIPVGQVDSSGVVIAIFANSREAERVTGIESRNIRSCVSGDRQHAGGFSWIRIRS